MLTIWLRLLKVPCFVLLTTLFWACDSSSSPSKRGIESTPRPVKVDLDYPETAPDTSVIEQYHTVPVADSYRWLEDFSPRTGNWLAEQNSLSDRYFDKIDLHRVLQKSVRKYWNYERFTLPKKKGEYYFFVRNSGLQKQDVWYRRKGINGSEEEVLNPNRFRNGEIVQDASPSPDGRYLAYQISDNGLSWRRIKIEDLENRRTLGDELEGVKFAKISWWRDGFFYVRYDLQSKNKPIGSKDVFHQLYYHQLGTPQSEDKMIFADRQNPHSILNTQITPDGQFLILYIKKNTLGNAFWFLRLNDPDAEFQIGAPFYDYDFQLIDNIGDNLLMKTNYQAPMGRLVLINVNQPAPEYWQEVIPESKDVMQKVEFVNNKIVACYLRDTYSVAKVYNPEGKYIGNLKLPERGKVKCFEGDKDENLAFFGFSTLTKPQSVYSVHVDKMVIRPYLQPEASVQMTDCEIEFTKFPSSDGEMVPMYLVYQKGLERNGANPTLLVVNGGLEEQLLPKFNPTGLNLMPFIVENGGVVAMVNIRGGKELGRNWQLAGLNHNKRDGVEDFKMAAKFLIANKYSSRDKLAIYGRGNGGLIAGALAVQEPDLCKVLVTEDGIFDALRYDKFSIGWMWKKEYGDSQNKRFFDDLYAYSPVHNIQDQSFPASLIIAGQQNDIIVPFHSYKFTAELQTHQIGEAPILLHTYEAGNGFKSITDNAAYFHQNVEVLDNRIQRSVDILAFMYYNLQGQLLK